MNWETVDNPNRSTHISRCRVPFGWLVTATEDVVDNLHERREAGYEWRTSITFVFDPFKMWKV